MDQPERDAFLAQPQVAVLSTLSKDGRIHSVPLWYLYADGVFRVTTARGSAKHRNVERAGRASICIDQRDGAYRYVTAEGPVTVSDPVTFNERLAIYTHYRGDEEARRIVGKGGHEKMVTLVLTPERWLSYP